MARVTVEDCLEHVNNKFELATIAAKRARQRRRDQKQRQGDGQHRHPDGQRPRHERTEGQPQDHAAALSVRAMSDRCTTLSNRAPSRSS